MIRLGLQLTVRGGREALIRLIGIAVAVTIGTAMLLTVLAGVNAVNNQNARYAWLATGSSADRSPGVAPGVDPLWGHLSDDTFKGSDIVRADIAATGPKSPVPPGLSRLPGPGEYAASPALIRLLRSVPADELADRYPGRLVATIGNAGLPSPDSLIVVVGRTVNQARAIPGAAEVWRLNTAPPNDCGDCPGGVGINENGIDLILAVVALGMLFPVVIFIGSATRLAAARREQRFAAMRLVGATPRQISILSTVETSVAVIAGTFAGLGLFFALRPLVATLPFTGDPFFTSDLSLSLSDVLAVAIGVPFAAALAARIALRRVVISPLGVSRRTTPKPPTPQRLWPLLAGVLELAYVMKVAHPQTGPGQVFAYVLGFALVMIGLVTGGPWLTMVVARRLTRRTSRPSALIAGRRLADDPRGGFRAISGLVLALFIGTVAVAVVTTFIAHRGVSKGSPRDASTLVQIYNDVFFDPTLTDRPTIALPATLVSQLQATAGVEGVAVVHSTTAKPQVPPPAPRFAGTAPLNVDPQGVVLCSQLARTPVMGGCPSGALAVTVPLDVVNGGLLGKVWQASTLSPQQISRLPAISVTVATNGTAAAIERARTVMNRETVARFSAATINEVNVKSSRQAQQYQQLAEVIILASLPVAGCSLAVSVGGGLAERRRPFSLLRLSGVPLSALRRVVLWESVAPLLAAAAVAVLAGFATADLFLRSQLGYSLQAPRLEYYVVLGGGLLAALAILATMLPLLRRITGPEVARNG
jgi:hypothetical protein